jgi:hypothetical protein
MLVTWCDSTAIRLPLVSLKRKMLRLPIKWGIIKRINASIKDLHNIRSIVGQDLENWTITIVIANDHLLNRQGSPLQITESFLGVIPATVSYEKQDELRE